MKLAIGYLGIGLAYLIGVVFGLFAFLFSSFSSFIGSVIWFSLITLMIVYGAMEQMIKKLWAWIDYWFVSAEWF
jgi:uncharacterized membrane protein YczE